jgi:hypothetical protein
MNQTDRRYAWWKSYGPPRHVRTVRKAPLVNAGKGYLVG